jgi:predicted phage tail protein
MFSISLQNISLTVLVSLFFILGGHFGWNYLKDTLTTKKTKDLVNTQVEKYKKIVAELQETIATKTSETGSRFIDEKDKEEMSEDLLAFATSL